MRRQVFWQKRRVMCQKMVPSACHEVWQPRTRRGRWCTRFASYRVVCAHAVFHHDALPTFPVQRRFLTQFMSPLPSRQRAGKNAHRSRQTPRQLMRRRDCALCLLIQELTASGDRNSGGKTTLILTINNWPNARVSDRPCARSCAFVGQACPLIPLCMNPCLGHSRNASADDLRTPSSIYRSCQRLALAFWSLRLLNGVWSSPGAWRPAAPHGRATWGYRAGD